VAFILQSTNAISKQPLYKKKKSIKGIMYIMHKQIMHKQTHTYGLLLKLFLKIC